LTLTLSDADRFPWEPALPSAARKDIATLRALIVRVLWLHGMSTQVTGQPLGAVDGQTDRNGGGLVGHRRDPTPGHRRDQEALSPR